MIGFGTWPLGGRAYGPVEEKIALSVLNEALTSGIRFFDTADIYGDGRAETLLGQAILGVHDAVVVSKVGYLNENSGKQDFSSEYINHAVEASLQRLNRNHLDVLLLHSPSEAVLKNGEAYSTLEYLRNIGLTRRIGVSVRDIASFPIAIAWKECEVIEIILNLLDQRPIDLGFLKQAQTYGVEIIARVPLCFGFLAGSYSLGTKFTDQRGRWSQTQINQWIRSAEEFRFLERPDRSLAQSALAFCLNVPGVSWVIPGMKTVDQVRHNIKAGFQNNKLSETEIERARTVWRKLLDLPPRAT